MDDQGLVDWLFEQISPSERLRLLVLWKCKWVKLAEPKPIAYKSGRGDGPGVDSEKRMTHAVGK